MKANIIIPAKGSSQRLKNKNLLEINGKSLIYLACEKILKCSNINNVYIDSESDEIISNVSRLKSEGLKIIKRPKELANNDIGANEMMIYGLHSITECDIILQSFCTSPLIKSKTIDDCIEKFWEKQDKYDSFFTVTPTQEYFWTESGPLNFSPKMLPNSFQLRELFMETHGLYGIKTTSLIQLKQRIGLNPLKISIPKIESFDVNNQEDLNIVRRLLNVSG